MRAGFAQPIDALPAEDRDRLQSYFEDQTRIHLVAWVSHYEPGNEGRPPDHHVVLGMADDGSASDDPAAVLRGIEDEVLGPGSVDVFPLCEAETLTDGGTVRWERGASSTEDLDPLDFRFTCDPAESAPEQRASFGSLLRAIPAVIHVEGTWERLRKANDVVHLSRRLFIEYGDDREQIHGYGANRGQIRDAPRDVEEARKTAGLPLPPNHGSSLGLPGDPRARTAVLHESSERE